MYTFLMETYDSNRQRDKILGEQTTRGLLRLASFNDMIVYVNSNIVTHYIMCNNIGVYIGSLYYT